MNTGPAVHADRLKAAFAECLAAPAREQAACLDAACAGDAEFRRRVKALLDAHSQADGFLVDATRGAPENPANHPSANEAIGIRIGHYKLLQLIGEGGFGNVFMAEQQEPVIRRVALKIIKLGMDTRQVIARFEAERQALAMMDHPNIAKVLDAGATDLGRPYFVMELVRGDPITTYCDRANLDPRERLRLFQQVCHAVQHAHTKGIIHRDLKPSNVLVTVADGAAVPKVIDFGIAKATNAASGVRLTDKTLFTEHRALIGTPEYMSPEQADPSGMDIDTRSDVYSLGVLLYELLTGATPFDPQVMRSGSYAEVQRVIREVDPPKPSTRLSGLGETLAGIALRRRTEPGRLRKIISGDLDWIVMKCLEKERGRRYETASALAQDIQRYLSAEPVVAAPPSAVYRARKFVRRNRGMVVGAALLGFALTLGLGGTLYGLQDARSQRDAATAAGERESVKRKEAERLAEFMEQTLQAAGPEVALGRDATMIHEMMESAASRIERGELADVPDAQLRLLYSIAWVYRQIAEFPRAEAMLSDALTLSRRIHPGDHEWNARVLNRLSVVLAEQKKLNEALRTADESLAMMRRLHGAAHPDIVPILLHRSVVLHDLHRLEEAERDVADGLAMHEKFGGDDWENAAAGWQNLAAMHRERGDFDGAAPLYQKSLDLLRRKYSGDHPSVATLLHGMGMLAYDRKQLDEAEGHFQATLAMARRLYDQDHPLIALALESLAGVARERGDVAGAVDLMRQVLDIRRRVFEPDSIEVARALSNLAALTQQTGDNAGAADLFAEALDISRRRYPAQHPEVMRMMTNLAYTLTRSDQHEEAIALRHEMLAMQRGESPQDLVAIGRNLAMLATSQSALDRLTEAEQTLRECLAVRRQSEGMRGAQPWQTPNTMSMLGGALTAQARDESLSLEARLAKLREAEPLVAEAYERMKDDPEVPRRPASPEDRHREALQRVVDLHELWETLEQSPERGAMVAKWNGILAQYDAGR